MLLERLIIQVFPEKVTYSGKTLLNQIEYSILIGFKESFKTL